LVTHGTHISRLSLWANRTTASCGPRGTGTALWSWSTRLSAKSRRACASYSCWAGPSSPSRISCCTRRTRIASGSSGTSRAKETIYTSRTRRACYTRGARSTSGASCTCRTSIRSCSRNALTTCGACASCSTSIRCNTSRADWSCIASRARAPSRTC